MRTILRILLFATILPFCISCHSDSDDNPIPTVNTDEYFRYTIDGEPERVFFVSAKGSHTVNTSVPASDLFFITAKGENFNGNPSRVIASFSYPVNDISDFLGTQNFPLGFESVSTPKVFRFYESTEGRIFDSNPTNAPTTNPLVCTVTSHAANVGVYMEFTFSGNVSLDNTSTNTILVTGSARVLREL